MQNKTVFAALLIFVLLATACALISVPTPTPTADPDLEGASHSLVTFFALLGQGDYASAVRLHAGDEEFFETIRQNNPDVDPADRAALLQAACERQLRCMVVKNVLNVEQVGDRLFRVTVEFANPDGSTFVLGPCCGANETEMPPVSQFEYQVEKVGEEFLVHGSPVYVP